MSANDTKPHQKLFDIAIVGETNLDLILYGLPERMPVERELLANGFDMTLGGSSSILAHNLASLGTRVGFVSEIGNDAFGTDCEILPGGEWSRPRLLPEHPRSHRPA